MKTNRRDFFQKLVGGIAALGLTSFFPQYAFASKEKKDNIEDDQVLFMGDDIAIVDTVYGKVKGFILHGIYQYRGIPYGADTSGKNRFMPPQKPKPWSEIYPALWWGNAAPQVKEPRYKGTYGAFKNHWNYDDISEDCLKLNVWTPSISDRKKRPVLVWFHGGGFTNGNAIEQDGFMGENLSRKGDVVFVSINHRLGSIGFSDFSALGGDKYADSGNVGVLDMVAALKWVQENISNFGGNPANVTIMGQSGGGAKVCIIAAMPKAKGLFHKIVPLSGSAIKATNQEITQKLGNYILSEAGLKPSEIHKLQEVPWKDYIELTNRATKKYVQENKIEGRIDFRPVADGVNIPKDTFFNKPNGISHDVPMLLCSTFHERSLSTNSAELENISEEEAKENLALGHGTRIIPLGNKASKVYDAYKKSFPYAKPIELLNMIASNRKRLIETANTKAIQKAPVYVAWFGWNPPLFSNRLRAFHCSDICFWFYNTDLMVTHTGGGKRPRNLSEKMSDALLQFMRTGKPSAESLPEWPKYTIDNGETLILNDVCMVKNNPDKEALKTIPS